VNYPFLTTKERDNETGLDYFLARYYSSTQGRFTGVDPYDINLERQYKLDPKEAESLFREYLRLFGVNKVCGAKGVRRVWQDSSL
jgi:RHS repeat-associated protein